MAIKPSPRFAALLLLCHVIAALAVYATAMPLWAGLAITPLILLSLFYYMARDVLFLLPSSWRNIALNQNIASVTHSDSSNFCGQVESKTFVSPYFIVLRIKRDSDHLPVSRVIFPDALGTGEFRELCVHLKFA